MVSAWRGTLLPRAMDPKDSSSHRFSWREVEQQVAAGLILASVAGIAFIAYTVPRQLDLVIQTQKVITDKTDALEARVGQTEGTVQRIEIRVTRLESSK